MTVSRFEKLAVEFHLSLLARERGLSKQDPRMRAVRSDALLYVSEGASPRDAVAWAAVHAFKLYGLPPNAP